VDTSGWRKRWSCGWLNENSTKDFMSSVWRIAMGFAGIKPRGFTVVCGEVEHCVKAKSTKQTSK
jgi:hypothetical protein